MNAGEMGRGLSETEKTEISSVVGVSALKFADLMNERMKNYIFDEDKLTSTEGKTGPYVLYALVRMKSVLEKMGATREITDLDKMTITESAERQLLLRLYQMPESLQTAYDNNAPHVICDYLYKLAQDFNVFYHDCPIKDAEETVKTTRLALTKYALAMGEKMAWILGLRVPEKM
jgi:arginyl-tRNA synthetase